MAMTAFTSNISDHSTDNGFQFEFHCDKCGNGVMSTFVPSKVGMAGNLLKAAGSLFGNAFYNAGHATDFLRDQTRGKARDDALRAAVEAARPHFKQCSRCGQWVCPEHCWNHARGQCESCAPDLQEELAAAQASVAAEQVWERARNSDLLGGLNVAANDAVASCSSCGAKATGGKFCQECGNPMTPPKPRHCGGCGAALASDIKFCNECGTRAA